jgi:hypothetical protein
MKNSALLLVLSGCFVFTQTEETLYMVTQPLWRITYEPLREGQEPEFEGHKTNRVRQLFVQWIAVTGEEKTRWPFDEIEEYPASMRPCETEQIQWDPPIWEATCKAVIDGSDRLDQILVPSARDNEKGPEWWEGTRWEDY